MKLFGHEVHFSLRRKRSPEEMVCFGCGRDGESATKLIAGPRDFICDRCVDAARLALTEDDEESGTPLVRTEGGRCSFCNTPIAMATAGGEVGICLSCIGICASIIAEDLRNEARQPG